MSEVKEKLRVTGRMTVQVIAPALIGALTGACVAGMIGGIEQIGLEHLARLPGILPGLFGPLALFLTYLVSRYITPVPAPATSELYISVYHQLDPVVPVEQTPGRVLATTATVGLGGSQGFESTSALVGASWGTLLCRLRPLRTPAAHRCLIAAGASAGIAAVFSSPSAGALYGIEVPYKRDADLPHLTPAVVAAICSYATRCWLIGVERIVNVEGTPLLNMSFLAACLFVAILSGLGARLYANLIEWLRELGRTQYRGTRALLGGAILAILAACGFELCGAWITFGSGYYASGWFQAEVRPLEILLLAFLVRASANLITVYGGGGGGVFTSLACNGAFIGEIVAVTTRCDDTHTLALFGAACFLGAGYRLPVACMLFVAEAGLGPLVTGVGLLMVATATVAMGDATVSEGQQETR